MRAQKTVSEQSPDRGLPPDPTSPRGSGRLYAATWTVLGMLSLGYIGVLLLQPEWAVPITTQSLRMQEVSRDPAGEVERLTGEVDSLRRTIAELRLELTDVKSKAAAREVEIINEQSRAAIEPPSAALRREAVQETAAAGPDQAEEAGTVAETAAGSLQLRTARREPPPAPAVLPEPPPLVRHATAIQSLPDGGEPEVDVKTSNSGPEARQVAAGSENRDAQGGLQQPSQPRRPKPAMMPIPPAPVRKVVVLDVRPANRPAPPVAVTTAPSDDRRMLRMATGSLQPTRPPTITFGPPTVTPASETFAIRLDAGPSLDALRLRWSVLNDRYGGALGGLEPRYLKRGSMAAPSYELLAGPVASVEEASRICARLQARRVPCSVGGPFAGETL